MELTDKKIWRFIAILTCSLCTIAGILNLVLEQTPVEGELIAGKLVGVVDLLTAIPLFILIFKTEWMYLFTSVCLFQGFFSIADKGNIDGCLLFLLGWSIAFKEGFFRTATKRKLVLVFSMIAVPLLMQLRFGYETVLYSLVYIAFMIVVFILMFIIFRTYLITLLPAARNKPKVNLEDYELMERDYDFIRRVRDYEKYSAIAIDYKISESAIKQRMSTIYRKLGVEDRSDFLVFCNSVELVFPERRAPVEAEIRESEVSQPS